MKGSPSSPGTCGSGPWLTVRTEYYSVLVCTSVVQPAKPRRTLMIVAPTKTAACPVVSFRGGCIRSRDEALVLLVVSPPFRVLHSPANREPMLVQTLILHGPVDRYDWAPTPRSDARPKVSSQLDRGDLLACRCTKLERDGCE